MRWIFADENADDKQSKLQTQERIRGWWREFESRQKDIVALLRGGPRWDLPEWIITNLGDVHSGLMWEFGPAVRCDGFRLVITPETQHELRPMVRSIIDLAPKLNGWEFYDARLAEDLPTAIDAVRGRIGISFTKGTITPALDDLSRIQLNFQLDAGGASPDDCRSAAFVLTESLLGERDLNDWIGPIEGQSSSRTFLGGLFGKRRGGQFDIEQLKPVVQSLQSACLEQLPAQPWHTIDPDLAQWTLFEKQRPSTDKIDFARQDDVYIGTALHMPLVRAIGLDPLFSSRRFSRCGERFAFVKVDAIDVPNDDRVQFRGRLEDSINGQLRDAGLGCVVGAATGIRYAYLTLALCDLQKAVHKTRQTLRELSAPQRSWIMFHDAEFADEWVGVHESTEAPPALAGGFE